MKVINKGSNSIPYVQQRSIIKSSSLCLHSYVKESCFSNHLYRTRKNANISAWRRRNRYVRFSKLLEEKLFSCFNNIRNYNQMHQFGYRDSINNGIFKVNYLE